MASYSVTAFLSLKLQRTFYSQNLSNRQKNKDCSLNIVFFSKNSRKFATSPSPALGCYWSYKKLPANRSYFTLALRWDLKVSYSDVGEIEVAVNCEKTQSWTPCLNIFFFLISLNLVWTWRQHLTVKKRLRFYLGLPMFSFSFLQWVLNFDDGKVV